MPVAIALADDSLIVREGVGQILATEPEMRVVASCGDLPSLMAAVDTERPDVVVTTSGCRRRAPTRAFAWRDCCARRTRDRGGRLSNYAEPAYALALLESGSEGRAIC
jgi:DNA-binding NarL/FixJ family response regulator